MKLKSTATAFSILYLAASAFASTFPSEGKDSYEFVKKNLIAMAEAMPEGDYAFKPTPQIRSFGEMVAHVSNAQNYFCSMVPGEGKKGANVKGTESKSELVAALKESSAFCDAAWAGVTDASAVEMVKMGKSQRSKLGVLSMNNTHDNEEYGYMAVYLRLKGIVPPSSAGK